MAEGDVHADRLIMGPYQLLKEGDWVDGEDREYIKDNFFCHLRVGKRKGWTHLMWTLTGPHKFIQQAHWVFKMIFHT
eukprot:10545576-Karenia_brevis.AAC.1